MLSSALPLPPLLLLPACRCQRACQAGLQQQQQQLRSAKLCACSTIHVVDSSLPHPSPLSACMHICIHAHAQ